MTNLQIVNAESGRCGLEIVINMQASAPFTQVKSRTTKVVRLLSSQAQKFVIGGPDLEQNGIGGMMESFMVCIVSTFLQVNVKL